MVWAFDVFVRQEENKFPIYGDKRDETAKQSVEDALSGGYPDGLGGRQATR